MRSFDVIKFKWAAFGGGKKSGLKELQGAGMSSSPPPGFVVVEFGSLGCRGEG